MPDVIVAISGSRSIRDKEHVYSVIKTVKNKIFKGKSILFLLGDAVGVDTIARCYMEDNNISYRVYPARWSVYGKKAGVVRNAEMAKDCDVLVAIWDGVSKGTEHAIKAANFYGKPVIIFPKSGGLFG